MPEKISLSEPKEDKRSPRHWIKSQQGWTWIITITWMTIANFWAPFGLFGFVCMFTPIILALLGYGKMSCARICPRGSLIGKFTGPFSLGLKMPAFMKERWFKTALWAVMMGSFIGLMIWAIPQGVDRTGRTVLYFMETATALALLDGLLFQPRSWCVICPMGFTSGNIRNLLQNRRDHKTAAL